MLNIPSSVKALFQADCVHKNFRVHFPNGEMADITNDNVVQESVKFTESLCSQSTFKFGLAEASVLEFETVGIGNMYGMTIEASIEIDCSSLSAADKSTIAAGTWDGTWDSVNSVFSVPYGTFRVDSCPRDHQSMAHRQVTAYTDSVLTPRTYWPQRMLGSTIHAKTSAIRSMASGGGLVQDSTATFAQQNANTAMQMFDSNGNVWYIHVLDGDNGNSGMFYKENLMSGLNSATDYPSFARFNLPGYNAAAYDAFGVAVANAITSNGIDLRYNKTGSKIFNSNEEALRYCTPWLFSPCICYGDTIRFITQKICNNMLIPIVCNEQDAGVADFGFFSTDIGSPLAYALVKATAGNSIQIQMTKMPTSTVTTINLSLSGVLDAVPTDTRYILDSYYGDLIINNTGEAKTYYTKAYPNETLYKNGYSYDITSETLLKLFEGAVEIYASFSKANRSGSYESVQLDNSSPISIAPDNYSEMWWDEFDVDPIGSVIITYKDKDEDGNDKENTTTISIGSGSSVYDMSNNEALKNLEFASYSDVVNLVKSSFAPYVGAAAFTPIELTMQGWPWLEAGDALEITAEDGTVVESYALRVEMSGIQHLQATITAEGGEIIEEVE